MARMDYYFVLTMMMSLMWGILVVSVGTIIRFGLGQIIGSFVADVKSLVRLEAAINSAGQNICPVETTPPNTINVGGWAVLLGALVIVTGIIVIMFSVLGFVAGLKHNNFLLILVVMAILVACILKYYLLQVATDESDSFHDTAKGQMIDILRAEFEVENEWNIFSNTMNAIMLTAQCCGIQGPRDFINVTFKDEDQNNEIVYFKVSPACCKRHLFNKNPMEAFPELRRCSINGPDDINSINTQGCYSTIFHHISENYGILIAVSLISLAIWEIMQLILAVLIIFTPPPRRRESHRSTVHTKSVVEIEEKPKKFVPYSKISSFQSKDLERIRSTEIW